MSAAATPDRDELRERLAELYPGDVALGVLPLCGPRCAIHFGKPCGHPGKVPIDPGWTADAAARWGDPDADADRWRERMADHKSRGGNLGWCGPANVLVLDADTLKAVAYLERALEDSPVQDTKRGAHYPVRLPEGVTVRARSGVEIAPGVTVDLRPGLAAQVVVEPSIHASGAEYTWRRSLPADLGELAEIPAGLLAAIVAETHEREATGNGGTGAGPIPAGKRNDTLHRIACAMRARGEAPDAILAELRRVNAERCRPRLEDDELRQIARSAERYPAGDARDDDASASETEDLANAQRLAAHHGRELRWSAGRGWLAYTGAVWEESEIRALAIASRLGRIIQRDAAERAEQTAKAEGENERERLAKQAEALLRWARASEQAKRIRAALDLARPMLEIREEELDADRYLLGCRNGVVDLRDGTLRPHRPEDYLTRCTGVDFDPEARSELWDRVLKEALPDEPVRDYLRRCAGYTALGVTGEDVLLLVHGPTRTSKGTLQGAIAAALGSYAMTAGLETFAQRRHADGTRARPELIRMRGARMVSVYETGRALKLDAPLVKSLAGSDSITARQLYREEVEFRPACTLWLATNHRPLVDDDDDALWERMREIPFRVYVPREKRDPSIRARLADPDGCGPAVLAWIVRGTIEYQRDGLAQPEAVTTATGDYRSAMDPIGEFLGECCTLNARAWTATAALREDYEKWCRERGDRPLPANRWGESLRRHGCESGKVAKVRGWHGIGLRHEEGER